MDLSKLNKNQLEAVTHDSGPAILVAGAGTGKTTVITQRIAWLIETNKAKADEIVALTFTDKAAAEMEERVDKLLPLGYVDTWIQTFHSFADKLLRKHGLDIGLPADYKLLDQTAAWLLVRQNLNRFDLDYYRPLGNPTKFIHALVNHFSRCKDELVYPDDYLKYAEDLKLNQDQVHPQRSRLRGGRAGDREAQEQEISRLNEIAKAYHVYQTLMLENSALDFGDLINYCLQLFKKRSHILAQYQQQFKYILVDEFQDTNWAQYELVKIMLTDSQNIMVVGDDDQAIYKFRGASVSNILAFHKDFPAAKQIFLVDNYRSGQLILDKAYDFIQLNNPDRLEVKLGAWGKGQGRPEGGGPMGQVGETGQKLNKKLISHKEQLGQLEVSKFSTKEDEVRGVLEEILRLKETAQRDPSPSSLERRDSGVEGFSWNHVAILSRSNEEAQRFVRVLRSAGLPHQFLAAKGLYSQEIIINVLSYIKLLDNYHESPALYQILATKLWNLSHEDLVNLNHLASRKSWSLYQTLKNYHGQINLSEAGAAGLAKLLNLIDKHRQLAERQPVSSVIYQFLEDSGYLELLTLEDNHFNREQLNYLNQFYRKVRQWEEDNLAGNLHDFVTAINLELESGEAGSLVQDLEVGPEAIKVMTVHGAKGLEFRYVFIIGLVHLRFPSIERADPIELPEPLIKDTLPEGDSHLQEERRLMYVALTRAKDKVYLSWAEDYGQAKKKKPSRFLDELKLLESVNSPIAVDLKPLAKAAEPAKAKYKLPAKLSFTQLKTFETCPYQYYYSHIIKIPAKGSAVFSFGQTMHKTLQKFFQLVIDRSQSQQKSLFEKPDRPEQPTEPDQPVVSLKELLKIYDQVWQDDWFLDQEQKDKYRRQGLDILKAFYAKVTERLPVPLFLEKGFNLKVGDVTIRGIIDRVDKDDQGRWKIIDYKTGTVKESLAYDDKKQLLIYQLAGQEVFNSTVGSLSYYYLNENKELAFEAKPEELEKTKKWIADTAGAIKDSDFAATPGFHCKSCDYNQICPFAQR